MPVLTPTLGGNQFLEVQGEFELPHTWVSCLPGPDALFIHTLDKDQNEQENGLARHVNAHL